MTKVTVDLEPAAVERIARAARARQQTLDAFLAQAAVEAARRAALDEAIAAFEGDPDAVSFSELASEYGLAVEEIMREISRRARVEADESGRPPEELARATDRGAPEMAEEMFLASCRTLARLRSAPDLLRQGEDAVAARRAEDH